MPADASRSPKSYKSGIQTWSLVIAILFIVPGAYAFLYFTDRDDYLTNRYFRALGELDRQINQGIVGLDRMLNSVSPENCSKNPKDCTEYSSYLQRFSHRFSQVRFSTQGDCNGSGAKSSFFIKDKTYFEVIGVSDKRKIVTFECHGSDNQCADSDASRGVCENDRFISASVALSALIDPTPALHYFDQVLLLDSQGDVIYRSGKDDLAKTENIAARDDYARFENLGHYLHNKMTRTVNLSAGVENFSVDKKSLLREVSHSTIREATIGNVDYRLFIQPFHPVREQLIPHSSAQGESDKTADDLAGSLSYLVGVVPYDRYFLDIVSLPLWKITNLFLLFLFLLAVVPHLKLYFSGSHFMPNRVFVWWLGITFPLLTIVICNAWFSWEQYDELIDSMDQEAKNISAKVQANFKREISLVMEKNRSNKVSTGMGDCAGRKVSTKTSYPSYGIAFFLDKDGRTTGCLQNNRTVKMNTSASVKKRRYFSVPGYHPERLFSWISQQKTGEGGNVENQAATPYYSERIQSYDHFINLTALSFPLKENGICSAENGTETDQGKGRPCVFSVVKLMQTFFAPVLPLGFGFAVINDHSGEVYYHSNDQRSLLENFYIETDKKIQLIAAVESRHSQFLSGIYNARPHRFYTSPLQGTPWSLVVFYDTGSIELANLRTLLLSLVYAARATALILLIPLLTCLVFSSNVYRPMKTLLPNGKLMNRIHAGLHRTALGRLTESGFPVIYVGSAIAIIFVVFGTISWLGFSHAGKNQIERLQRFNLLHSGQAISERMKLLHPEQQRLGISSGKSRTISYLNDKLLKFAIYYPQECKVYEDDSPSYSECTLELPTKGQENFSKLAAVILQSDNRETAGWIDRYLPLFSAFDASYLQMRYRAATDLSWYFTENPAGPLLYIRSPGPERYARIYSGHPVPHAHQGLRHGEYTGVQISLIFALFLGIIVLYQLGKLTATRLMGLYLPDPRTWANQLKAYRQEAPVAIIPEDGENRSVLARANLATIAEGDSQDLKELRAMLYSRARDRIINTYNVKPVMWLILGGILRNGNGLAFYDPAMKKWIRQQPWRHETQQFFAAQSSDLWRVLAPSFYVLLLLGFVLITISGGKIGDFLMGIIPIILAGGIPAVTQLIRERLK